MTMLGRVTGWAMAIMLVMPQAMLAQAAAPPQQAAPQQQQQAPPPQQAPAQQAPAPAPAKTAPNLAPNLGSSDISVESSQTEGNFTLRVNSDLVLTNVVVRDKKTGNVIQGLKQSDFTLLENGKPQKITSFDFQNVDEVAALDEKQAMGQATQQLLTKNGQVNEAALRNHRLIVMFFDVISMQPEDVTRAVNAAKTYVNTKMGPADLVA